MGNNYTLKDELTNCIKFFLDYTNFIINSPGYGLTLDNSRDDECCSIASSGFMLSALVIAINNNIIGYEEGKEKVYLSLKNIYENVDHHRGLLVHFVKFNEGRRYRKCEYSTIDTALFLSGAIVCDAFFKDAKISALVNSFMERIDWNYYVTEYKGKKVIRMAYNDYNHNTHNNYSSEEDGFIYQWHMYAEQLIVYFLMASNDNVSKQLALDIFNGFRRDTKEYGDKQFVRCPTGSLFTYQFSHCYFDFKNYLDGNGYDWFENSRLACLDNHDFCQKLIFFKSFEKGLWGVSASDGPSGYEGYGIPPYDYDERLNTSLKHIDGTIAPYSIISSLPFIDDIALKTLNTLNNEYSEIIGEYGYKDSMNLDRSWYSKRYYGIDKGASAIMIENYQSNLIWNLFTNHPLIKKAIDKLDFKRR